MWRGVVWCGAACRRACGVVVHQVNCVTTLTTGVGVGDRNSVEKLVFAVQNPEVRRNPVE